MIEPFRLIKSETIPLTLQLAERQRAMPQPLTQRPLKVERVNYLRGRIEAGLFLPVSWATATMLNGDPTVVGVNGQHSSAALCSLKGQFPYGLKCHLDHYEVKDEKGMVVLFRQFDARVSNRTRSEVAGAYQGGHPDLRNLKKRFAMISVDGIGWWRRQLEGTPVPPGDGVYGIFQDENEHPFIKWANVILTNRSPELYHKAVVAAMYESYLANPEAANTFWTLVVKDGVYDTNNHPATKLSDWLKNLLGKRPLPGTLYQGCMYAWNAFLEGKTIISIKADARRALLRSN